jgi:hypothetical protein
MKLCFEFKTPEEALEYLFNEAEQSCLKNANRIKREDLIGRNYNVNWCNDTVSIEFLDEIFMNKITGRSFPEKTTCCIVRFPTNQ